jgi:hypothetical protein
MIELKAYWGNDNADSTIVLSNEIWQKISLGESFSIIAESTYEGIEETVTWSFGNGYFSIGSHDGGQCICAESIEALIVKKVQ